ncbi:Plasmodium variant antigen protein Cir/Yir/Bir, putative [Plasmodium berghei]|uniref:Plasmodium variant antigen protein Cir/Yir/Bir, putative n=1 Tax=Plasmodium berghei TaxID=5821 RepID=A0A1D3L665_PLABE|nr:Plasmodium variant antigen protein Cir/Yir/Bir, putative [Plasmodium berghei]
MDHQLCGRFRTLRAYLPDELNESTTLDFHNNGSIRNYCPNGDSGNTKECKTDLDKINAACLWLFQQNIIINIDSLSKEKSEAFIIYIMICFYVVGQGYVCETHIRVRDKYYI